MSDATYVAAVRDAFLAIIVSSRSVGSFEKPPNDYEAFRTCVDEHIRNLHATAKLIGQRLVEIARKHGMPDAESWGEPLRTLLVNGAEARPAIPPMLVRGWFERLHHLALLLEFLSNPGPAASGPGRPATIAILSTDDEWDLAARGLEAVEYWLRVLVADRFAEKGADWWHILVDYLAEQHRSIEKEVHDLSIVTLEYLLRQDCVARSASRRPAGSVPEKGTAGDPAALAGTTQISVSMPLPPAGVNPYLMLKKIVHDLVWLAAEAKSKHPNVFERINPTIDRWSGAELLARRCSAGWGISVALTDATLTIAKALVRDLIQVALGNETVPFSVTDSRFLRVDERLQHLADSVPAMTNHSTLDGSGPLTGGANKTVAPRSPSGSATAIEFVSPGLYRIGEGEPFVVDDCYDDVLQPFLEKSAMDKQDLINQSGRRDAPRVLSRLRKKYDGRFAQFIHLPGKKSNLGYRVTIRRVAGGTDPAPITHS
jgi:hypothetical protein